MSLIPAVSLPLDAPGHSWSGSERGQALLVPGAGAEINLRLEGAGPPVLLLHGYPQNHRIWRRCLPMLAEHHTCIMPDLRGYGDSSKPDPGPDAAAYAKRAMAADMAAVLDRLGIGACAVVGHDRGARVAHRLALDHPERVTRLAVIDILPTIWHDRNPSRVFSNGYWHWPFLAAGESAEVLLRLDPGAFLEGRLRAWSRTPDAFAAEDLADYRRCFSNPDCIRATCGDYRASAGIDLDHDGDDLGRLLPMPLLTAWGTRGFIGTHWDPPSVWREFARTVRAAPIDCGHFPAEECPAETAVALLAFLTAD